MEENRQIKGVVFDVQGFSVHDGPGCRTVVFMKGCPLRCQWCSNPEGLAANPEILYYSSKCILDANCVAACKYTAISIVNNSLQIDRQYCFNCKEKSCIATCLTGALKLAGKTYTTGELFQIIQRDRSYWGADGGITLSGGEPFLQPEFATDILKRCYSAFIHTAVETCGAVPWSNYKNALDYIDWIFFDLKHLDTTIHKQITQAGNEQILSNAEKLAKHSNTRMVFRTTIIPGLNDTDENILQTAEFIKSVGKRELNILPLHHWGREKYNSLGLPYMAKEMEVPSNEILMQVKEKYNKLSIDCFIGSDTPF